MRREEKRREMIEEDYELENRFPRTHGWREDIDRRGAAGEHLTIEEMSTFYNYYGQWPKCSVSNLPASLQEYWTTQGERDHPRMKQCFRSAFQLAFYLDLHPAYNAYYCEGWNDRGYGANAHAWVELENEERSFLIDPTRNNEPLKVCTPESAPPDWDFSGKYLRAPIKTLIKIVHKYNYEFGAEEEDARDNAIYNLSPGCSMWSESGLLHPDLKQYLVSNRVGEVRCDDEIWPAGEGPTDK
jgi:hypothetical protein